VLVFRTKLTWQEARDSILDAEFAPANLTAQNGVQKPIAVASELLNNRQFTRVIVATEQGDHILGEVMNQIAHPHLDTVRQSQPQGCSILDGTRTTRRKLSISSVTRFPN
jgi:hypothetical protein